MKIFGELQYALAEKLNADPSTTVSGRLYYNTTSNSLKWYNGTGWVSALPVDANGDGAVTRALRITASTNAFDLSAAIGGLTVVQTGGTTIWTQLTTVGNGGNIVVRNAGSFGTFEFRQTDGSTQHTTADFTATGQWNFRSRNSTSDVLHVRADSATTVRVAAYTGLTTKRGEWEANTTDAFRVNDASSVDLGHVLVANGAWQWGKTAGLGTSAAYHISYGAIVGRNGTNARGSFTSVDVQTLGCNHYRNGSGAVKAITADSGYVFVELARSSSGGGQVLGIQTATAAQTADGDLTAGTTILAVNADGTYTIGPSGFSGTHSIRGNVNITHPFGFGSRVSGSQTGSMTCRAFSVNGGGTAETLVASVVRGMLYITNSSDNEAALFMLTEGNVYEIFDHSGNWHPADSTQNNRVFYTGSQLTLRNSAAGAKNYEAILWATGGDTV